MERDQKWFRLFISRVLYLYAMEYALLTDLVLGNYVNGTLMLHVLFYKELVRNNSCNSVKPY